MGSHQLLSLLHPNLVMLFIQHVLKLKHSRNSTQTNELCSTSELNKGLLTHHYVRESFLSAFNRENGAVVSWDCHFMGIPGRFYTSHIHQPEIHDVNSPVKKGFLSTIKGILQIFDKVGLSRHAEEPLLCKASLPDKIHTLFHQQRGQALPILPLVLYRVLQALSKDPWQQRARETAGCQLKLFLSCCLGHTRREAFTWRGRPLWRSSF